MAATRTTEYAQALLELTDGKSEEEVKKSLKDFVRFLAAKGKLKEAPAIMESYAKQYNAKHNIVEATITLINRLPAKTRLHLREVLKKKYHAREVHMIEKIDERLIGGMKIKVGDEVYDSSLKHSLKKLETQLLK